MTNNEIITAISKRAKIRVGKTTFKATKDGLNYYGDGELVSNHNMYVMAVAERRKR